MTFRVFYSWQSDLPSATNRSMVQGALEAACKAIRADDALQVVPVLDRDTAGATGSPDIAQTIFNKIATCDAVVADVSIVTGPRRKGRRSSSNPNVLIELGYAVGKLGWHRVILVANTVFGSIEDLPFDIRQRRCVPFQSRESDDERASTRRNLAGMLETRLRECIQEDATVEAEALTSSGGAATASAIGLATMLQTKTMTFEGQAYALADIFKVLVPALATGTTPGHAELRSREAFGFPLDFMAEHSEGAPRISDILSPLVVYDIIQVRPPQDGYDELYYLTPLGKQLARLLDDED